MTGMDEKQLGMLLQTFIVECESSYKEEQSAITQQLNELFASLPVDTALITTATKYLTAESASSDNYAAQLSSTSSVNSSSEGKGKCNVRLGGSRTQAEYYTCFTCSLVDGNSVVLCSDCFERGKHKQELHAYLVCDEIEAKVSVSCKCGDSITMKQHGWCEQHKTGKQQAPIVRVSESSQKARLQRIMPRLISRVLVQLRTDFNDSQLTKLLDFLVQLVKNKATIRVVWNVLCDEQWYTDVFQSQTASEQTASRPTVACTLLNEQHRQECNARLNKFQLHMSTDCRVMDLGGEFKLVRKCALDELMFWLISLGVKEPMLKFLYAYCSSVTSDGVDCGKYEFGRALVRQSLMLSFDLFRYFYKSKAFYANDTLNAYYIRFIKLFRHLFADQKTTLTLEQTDCMLLKVCSEVHTVLLQMYRLKPCAMTVQSETNALQFQIGRSQTPQVINLDEEYCLESGLSIATGVILIACEQQGVSECFLSGSGLKEFLRVAELFQAAQVYVRGERTMSLQLLLMESVLRCTIFSVVVPNSPQYLVRTSPAVEERRRDSIFQGIQTTRIAVLDWLTRYGVPCNQPVELVGNFTLPTEMTFNILLHRILSILIHVYVRLEDDYNRKELIDTVHRKQLLSQTESYYVVQHAVSTLFGDLEMRHGLWARNSTSNSGEMKSFPTENALYHSFSNCAYMVILDLLLAQYCAAQCNADQFLKLLAYRALHGDSVLSHTTGAETKEMRIWIESLAFLIVLLSHKLFSLMPCKEIDSFPRRQHCIAILAATDCTCAEVCQVVNCEVKATVYPRDLSDIKLTFEQVSSDVSTEPGCKRRLRNELWNHKFDFAICEVLLTDVTKLQAIFQRYLSLAGSAKDRADAVQRGVTVDTVWLPIRVPTKQQIHDIPEPVRPNNLLHSSTFYALVFTMLKRATDVGVKNSNVRKLMMYAVHLVRVALAYYEYDRYIAAGHDDTRVNLASKTEVEEVDEQALDKWYPVGVLQNVYACLVHTIGSVRLASDANRCISMKHSILTLLVKAYDEYAQQDYVAPNAATSANASAVRVARHELFATGADVIGALLDKLCDNCELIGKWCPSGSTNRQVSSGTGDATQNQNPPFPLPNKLKNLRITKH